MHVLYGVSGPFLKLNLSMYLPNFQPYEIEKQVVDVDSRN